RDPPPTAPCPLSLHDALPISLTNTFPALGILLFALGWLERDGLLTLLGSASLVLSAAIFAALGAAVALVGWDVVRGVVPTLVPLDRKSTRLNSSHVKSSYAVF